MQMNRAVDAGARRRPAILAAGLSPVGVLVGAILFAFSLTPSMVPRNPEIQGALGGAVFGIGYLFWHLLGSLLDWLELRVRPSRRTGRIFLAAAAILVVLSLWQGADWQNSIRAAWNLPPIDEFAPVRVVLLAGFVFGILLLLGRLFLLVSARWNRRTSRYLPPRASAALGWFLAVVIFWTLIDGVAFRYALRAIDNASRVADLLIPIDLEPPAGPMKSGNAASLIAWEDLGRWGRGYVTSAPTAEDIGEFWGEPAREPIRVYVGLTAAGSAEERARLAFRELLRVGGFDRDVLVIAMPTGSGWLDPGGMDTLDYMARGNAATVSVQYSYLSSPVSVIVDPTHGIDEARALFDLVYGHWTSLPPDDRPRLYLHGLSLGAFLSQETVPLLDLFSDPLDGALWTGSPFLSDFWRMVIDRRNADSPAWRPAFGNGSLIRTVNQDGGLDGFATGWGPMRFVLLQYGSDPIVFFDYALAWKRPDWLQGERAPDLSPEMRWIPVVTMLQVAVDMAVALGTLGYGHDYIARHYIPAWAAILEPEGWTPDVEARLVEHLKDLVPR